METRARTFGRIVLSLASAMFLLRPVLVSAENVINCWDETKKAHYQRRRLSTAINIYAKEGSVPQVLHESGILAGVEYDILRIDPCRTTFLKVDYSETPVYLSQLEDKTLLSEGYVRVGGINAGYFSNTNYQYGRPVGAVRVNNEWTRWHGELNTPAYGSGYATAYFNRYRVESWEDDEYYADSDLYDEEYQLFLEKQFLIGNLGNQVFFDTIHPDIVSSPGYAWLSEKL